MEAPSEAVTAAVAIQALTEHLVKPIIVAISGESDGDPPSDRHQETVGKQMHAVVLLYNYYHRKHFPTLKFLDFQTFCKFACQALSGLGKYMRYTNGMETNSQSLDNLSITEKMVEDACNICSALDASKASPDVMGWPLTKVVVFLVDSTEEKCLLHFSSVTQGAWSPVEKSFEMTFEEMVMERRKKKRRASNKKKMEKETPGLVFEIEDELEQLALSAVKQETGISPSDLSIVERSVIYSLSCKKEMARFYIMKYNRVESLAKQAGTSGKGLSKYLAEIPISNVIRSLQGSVVEPSFGLATSVADFFHILPFINVVFKWKERGTCSNGPMELPQKEVSNNKISSVSNKPPVVNDNEANKRSGGEQSKMNFQKEKTIQNEKKTTNLKDQKNCSLGQSTTQEPKTTELTKTVMKDHENRSPVLKKTPVKDNELKKRNESEDLKMCPEKVKTPKLPVEVIEISDKSPVSKDCAREDTMSSQKAKANQTGNKTQRLTRKARQLLEESSGAGSAWMDLKKLSPVKKRKNEAKEKATLNEEVDAQSKKMLKNNTAIKEKVNLNEENIDAQKKKLLMNNTDATKNAQTQCTAISKDSDNVIETSKNKIIDSSKDNQLQVAIVEPTMNSNISVDTSNDGPFLSEKIPEGVKEKGTMVVTVVQPEISTEIHNAVNQISTSSDLQLDLPHSSLDKYREYFEAMESNKGDLCENSLQLLLTKRDQICKQKRLIEDDLAKCEMDIQTKSIEMENMSSSDHQVTKRRKLSDAIFPIKNPWQELDDVCRLNNWMLPNYSVRPSYTNSEIDGNFVSSVNVKGIDFECTIAGDPKGNLDEARESAAMNMLSKLRSMAKQQ